MKKKCIMALIIGAAFLAQGCGYEEGTDAVVTVVDVYKRQFLGGVVSALFQKVLLSERLDASSELFGMVLAEAAAP